MNRVANMDEGGAADSAHDPEPLVLVVDDDPDNRRMLNRRLRRNGYRVIEAVDGAESLRMVEQERPDIVLMDYMMPVMSGVDALRRLRETYQADALPVIMVTAKTDTESVIEALHAGANDYLAKPIEMPVALARISAQMQRLEATRRLAAANRDLEARVAERTEALQAANELMSREVEQRRAVEAVLRTAKTDLEAASAAKTQFLANMSHELRTPLNAIIGFSEIMANGLLGQIQPPVYADYANDIMKSGTHLLQIINDILDTVRVESGKFTLRESAEPVDDIFKECERMMASDASALGVDLVFDVPPRSFFLRCDRRLVKQALINLVGNALKFTPKDGRIDVRWRLSDLGEFVIIVEDNGSGIPAAKLEEVMQPFAQLDDGYARRHGGLGLGLPLVSSIMKKHEGALTLHSDVGQGVTARLCFPPHRIARG